MEETVSAPLDPRVIEQEIAKMREKESSPYSAGVKTNLFTLLVFRGDGHSAGDPGDPVDTAIQYLLGRRPARIITLARSSAPRTEAWVSGRCFPDRRNRGVCFEEVRIEVGEDGVGDDPGAWAPLLIRDLPVFAWMADGLTRDDDRRLASLAATGGLVDKLLVDSSRAPAIEGADPLAPLRRLQEKAAGAFLVSDFSWRRARILREQSARAFDPPAMRAVLPSIRGVRLYGGSAAEASLFFAWLRVRLGQAGMSRDAASAPNAYPRLMTAGLDAEHAYAGPLAEGFRLTFFIEGGQDIDIGCTRGGCLSRGEEKGAYRFPSDGEILLDEVDSLLRDSVFLESLAHAGQSRAYP
jgi:glucose-6-phosphate dehydrogenase assembly protein OpcA